MTKRTEPVKPQPGLPISDLPTERVAARRDPEPTQGPGSAAGEVGDSATRAAFVAGAPIHDGNATTHSAENGAPSAASPAPATEAALEQPPSPAVAHQPATASRPLQPEDGPGPLNNQGQRVAVSFDPQNADEMYRYAQMLARSTLLPRGFYDRDDKEKKHARVGDVHFVLMKGRALGLHPMTSIGNINIIDGKAEVGALLMLSMVRKSGLMAPGGWKLVHSDDKRAVFATRRIDEDWTEFEYTIGEADLMGLLDKGRSEWAQANNQWKKQPRTMLRRRAQSMLLREVYPDVVLGCYDHDELTEMRERERALGIDPDRVIAAGAPAAMLTGGGGKGPIETLADARLVTERDPLKARLAARQADRIDSSAATSPSADADATPGERLCTACGSPLDERDTDPCIACR